MRITKSSPVAVWFALTSLVMDNKGIVPQLMEAATDMPWSRFRALRRVEDHPLTQRELVERMHVDASAMSVIVGDLVDRGYVERIPHPQDGRAKLVRITPAGTELMEQLRDTPDEVPAPVAGLTATERRELARLIDKMRASVEA